MFKEIKPKHSDKQIEHFKSVLDYNDFNLITIYCNPTDYPNKYVARLFKVEPNKLILTNYITIADTLQSIRKTLPTIMYKVDKLVDDDDCIVETYM